MDIRQIIESRLKDADMTKKELAERMGAHAGSLNSMIEAPSWPTLVKIAKALGMSVSDLVRDPEVAAYEDEEDRHWVPRSSDIMLRVGDREYDVLLMPKEPIPDV